MQGKTIETVDGKTVRFSGKSLHIANDVLTKENKLIPEAVACVTDVFKTGDFVERQDLYKARSGAFVAFHVYRKWVKTSNAEMLLQVKAGELDSGILEAGDGLIAYSAKGLETEKATLDGSFSESGSDEPDQPCGDRSASSTNGAPASSDVQNHTTIFDNASSDDYIFIEILAVRQKTENPNVQYLQSIIDGKTDLSGAGGFLDEFKAFIEQHGDDESLTELFKQALKAYQDFEVAKSKEIE